MPALSIIIPIYNAENYLHSCVNSILSQSYQDFELLLINDGSTDHSGEICNKYADGSPFIHVFHKVNGGVSSARNLGIKHAQGDYIIFVDSDDWLEANALSILMQQNNNADLTFFGSAFHPEEGDTILYKPERHFYDQFYEVQSGMLNLIINPLHPDYLGFTWNKIFKSAIIKREQICFIESLSYREDEIFTLQYAAFCSSLATLPDILYHYRLSDTGLTRKRQSSHDFILLCNAYQHAITFYNSIGLQEYFNLQTAKFLFDAVKIAPNLKTRNAVIDRLWSYGHIQNIPYQRLRIKPLYRSLLHLPSPALLKIYMYIRSLFH